MKTLGFYNHYGNGDIFESREFVKEIMENFPAEEYIYYTGKSHRLLMDIPKLLVSNDFIPGLNAMKPFVYFGDELYINTWIGRDGRYVLPGIGCTVEMLIKMYNDILSRLNSMYRLEKHPTDYLTSFNYAFYETEEIDEFMKIQPDGQRYVYVSNGNVQSNQASNFDMTPLIIKLANRFPDVFFFITQPVGIDEIEYPNIVDANRFAQGLPSNLPELSYLSSFCDVLIGRNSGSHVFAWTWENCMRDMLNITLTYHIDCAHFVHHTPMAMRKMWSNEAETDKLFDIIGQALEDEFTR